MMIERLRDLAKVALGISMAELTDFSAHLAKQAAAGDPVRCAIVADRPEMLAERMDALARRAHDAPPKDTTVVALPTRDAFLSIGARAPRIGFLFPGQG